MFCKIDEVLSKVAKCIVFGFAGVLCLYLFLNSIFSTCVIWYDTEQTYYIKDFPILLVGGLFGLLFILVLLRDSLKKWVLNQKIVIVALTIVWMILLLVFLMNTDIRLVYDQGSIYEGLRNLMKGNYTSWEKGGYYYNYPFQNGLALLYAPIMLFFKENTYWAVQGVNLICYFMLAVGTYKIAKEYFGKYVATCSYLMILYFVPLWGYVKYLYGNMPGVCFGIWSLYLMVVFIKEAKWSVLIGSVVCILFAMVCKGNFLIFTIAMCMVLLMESIHKKEWKYLIAIVAVMVATTIGTKGPSYIMHHITGCVTDQGIPTINCVAMGLRESYVAPGWYNGDSPKWFAEHGYSVEAATESAWQSIRESLDLFLREKEYALRFFNRKSASIWNNPTFECFAIVTKGNLDGTIDYWMKDILYSGGIANTVLTLGLDVVQSVILFGLIWYFVLCRKEQELYKGIPLVCFIGGYLLHVFWEAKCQYTIMFFILLFPYAFKGYEQSVKECAKLLENRQILKTIYRSKTGWLMGTLLAIIIVIGLSDDTFWTSTVKLQGGEADYVWLCREHAYWKEDGFTKEGMRK